ncbi:hypothetical protein PGT21_012970 [Puccinia graminis f. sp. tritici]|uniref:Uncharacterized protein n=1 Tax=Puccinia graminis f. sp. tritici TaxID=56615 RepID=A0A5B0NVM2_PUCGR|nr:hypothetical protein PGTUg99_003353 [Puccinia graminis f. sp. tritici]KAA1099579.1 hypothetical protein PGT21_012970 [Puccinia graminis f. sp. tritici]
MPTTTGSYHTVHDLRLIPQRDYLWFSGQFYGEFCPFLRARPNQGPLEVMQSSVYTSGKWKSTSGPTSIILARVYTHNFLLSRGGSHGYSGNIKKMDDGSIVEWSVKEVEEGANSRTWFVTVAHDVNNNTVDKVTVTHILEENTILIPRQNQFCVGDKLWVEGRLESVGHDSDGLIVQATRAIHFRTASRLPSSQVH